MRQLDFDCFELGLRLELSVQLTQVFVVVLNNPPRQQELFLGEVRPHIFQVLNLFVIEIMTVGLFIIVMLDGDSVLNIL